MDLGKILELAQNKDITNEISGKLNLDGGKVEDLLKAGLPSMLGSMKKNVESQGGAESLLKALKNHENDDVERMLKNIDIIDKEDGAKILGHLFGNDKDKVQNDLAEKTGIQANQVGDIMSMLAPILMGFLGNQQKGKNLDANGLSNILGTLSAGGKIGDMLGDVLEKGGGLGGVLGGLLGGNK